MCVFLSLNCFFHPSTSSKPSVRADYLSRYKLCGHKLRDRDDTSQYSKATRQCDANVLGTKGRTFASQQIKYMQIAGDKYRIVKKNTERTKGNETYCCSKRQNGYARRKEGTLKKNRTIIEKDKPNQTKPKPKTEQNRTQSRPQTTGVDTTGSMDSECNYSRNIAPWSVSSLFGESPPSIV